jgi:hypothetical protein
LQVRAPARVLLVGDKHAYNLKADKIQQPKERRVIEMTRVTGILMGKLPDDQSTCQPDHCYPSTAIKY